MMRNFRKNFMGVIVACACLAAAHGSVFGAEPARFDISQHGAMPTTA